MTFFSSDGKFPTRDTRHEKTIARQWGKQPSIYFPGSFSLSPHASRAPRILSLLQKPSPGAVAITLPRSGWKILHASRVTHENTLPGNGVSGLPRLLRPHLRAHSPHHQTRGTRRERMPRPFGSPTSSISPVHHSPPSCEEGIVEDKESIYINIRVRIRVTRAPACSMRKRTISKKVYYSLR